jgi:hypothetical protein
MSTRKKQIIDLIDSALIEEGFSWYERKKVIVRCIDPIMDVVRVDRLEKVLQKAADEMMGEANKSVLQPAYNKITVGSNEIEKINKYLDKDKNMNEMCGCVCRDRMLELAWTFVLAIPVVLFLMYCLGYAMNYFFPENYLSLKS